MTRNQSILLRVDTHTDPTGAVRALEAAGFRVLLSPAGVSGRGPGERPDLVLRQFSVDGGAGDDAALAAATPSIPVVSVDLRVIDGEAVVELVRHVLAPRGSYPRWMA